MADLAVITPTRGRPDRFAEMVTAVRQTATTDVEIWAGLDYDDSGSYDPVLVGCPGVVGVRRSRRSLSAWTNYLATLVLDELDPPRYLASLGDDHRPRTNGWDRTLIEAIEALPGGVGFAYGNDLFFGEKLSTAWVVSAGIVRALGWMMLPACNHIAVDNVTFELGRGAARLVYRPDVVIEHMHPYAGKAQWDESYRASNSSASYTRDVDAFEAWKRDGMAADVATVQSMAMAVG